MIKVENIDVWGFEHAIRGMRNPMNSWDKSDSHLCDDKHCGSCKQNPETRDCSRPDAFIVGSHDLDLMKRLYSAGSSDRKFMRQIMVSMDIIAPVYWLAEADTYKIATVRNSTSLMHTGGKRDFTPDDFSFEHLDDEDAQELVRIANKYRQKYADNKSIENMLALRQAIGMAYNYRITWTANYEVCANIINQRRNHRLTEWREFCRILSDLPYLKEIMGETE